MSSDAPVAPKKPYQKPSLKLHGNVQGLTTTVPTPGAKLDGGGSPKTQ
jgi:hypothetical protein